MPEQSPTRFTMVPARRSNEPTARRRARRVLGALFLAAGLSVVAVVIALSKGDSKPDLTMVNPKGRDLAYAAAVNFLAGNPQNVPHADSFDPQDAVEQSFGERGAPLNYQSLNWVGFTPQHFGSKKAGFTNFEVHHFLVVLPPSATATSGGSQPAVPGSEPSSTPGGTQPGGTQSPRPSGGSPSSGAPSSQAPSPGAPSPSPSPGGTGSAQDTPEPASNLLQLDVSLLLSARGPRLAAAPAFSVWQNGVGNAGGAGDYTNYGSLSAEVSDAAKNQILQWARAYVNGDSALLLALTGDQDRSHRYVGLSGFTIPESQRPVQILSAIKAADRRLIVRVRVLLARAVPGGTVPGTKKGSGGQFTSFADFDLLVGAPTGAQPPILAWGPAGSAAELEPYYNALGS